MENPAQASRPGGLRTSHYLLFAVVVVLLIALQMALAPGMANFTTDEERTVHAGHLLSARETVQWMGTDNHPPAWWVIALTWVKVFGDVEPMPRILSLLFTMCTFALVLRLGVDLFRPSTGLLAVLLLGIIPLFIFHTREFRPYAMLVMTSIGFQLAFVRWLRHQDFRRALILVGAGILLLYSHFFALYLLAIHVFSIPILVRWNRATYLRALGLFTAIGLSFVGWLLPFVHSFLVVHPGGIQYGLPRSEAAWMTVARLLYYLLGRPAPVGLLLLVTIIVFPLARALPGARSRAADVRTFRQGRTWGKWYLLIIAGGVILLSVVSNKLVGNLTHRNAMIILPTIGLLLALGLQATPRPVRPVLLAILVIWAFRPLPQLVARNPQQEIVAFLSESHPESPRIVIDSPANNLQAAEPDAVANYIEDRYNGGFPADDIFYFMGTLPVNPAVTFDNLARDTSAESLAHLEAFLDGADVVWVIDFAGGIEGRESILATLDQDYRAVREAAWEGPGPDHWGEYTPFTVTEYRRVD
ncbi:MAG: glycosyltransferase family 39 protein [Chloroflexota bacterium]